MKEYSRLIDADGVKFDDVLPDEIQYKTEGIELHLLIVKKEIKNRTLVWEVEEGELLSLFFISGQGQLILGAPYIKNDLFKVGEMLAFQSEENERLTVEAICTDEVVLLAFVCKPTLLGITTMEQFRMLEQPHHTPFSMLICISDLTHVHTVEEEFVSYLVTVKLKELAYLTMAYCKKYAVLEESWVSKGVAKKMMLIETLIRKNPEKEYTLNEFAYYTGTNITFIKVYFKRLFGKSVFAHLIQMRMEKALTLLKETDLNVTEIASEVGYKHGTHFTAAFKKYFGMPPRAFRQLH